MLTFKFSVWVSGGVEDGKEGNEGVEVHSVLASVGEGEERRREREEKLESEMEGRKETGGGNRKTSEV